MHLLASWSKPATTPPSSTPPPLLRLASWEILIKLMPNCSPWHREAEMFLFSIHFTLSMFFTAFHYLVLASFCSCSKKLDWIQWALFLTTHSLRVISIWKGDRKKRLSASQHMKGVHTLYIFTWPIFPFPFLSNVNHCTGWQKQGTVFCCVPFTVHWDKAHVLRLLFCCIRGLHYMSVYLAKAQQGLKVLISLYVYLCFCLLPPFFGGGEGD